MSLLEVDVRSLPEGLPGAYTEFVDGVPPALLVSIDLPYEDREALEAEAECYLIRGPRAKRKFCYAPRSMEEMNYERVRALRRGIEQKRPDWVERISLALRIDDNDIYKIIAYSGVPPYPAVAILVNMKERGELAG